jgi:hypothetical protein
MDKIEALHGVYRNVQYICATTAVTAAGIYFSDTNATLGSKKYKHCT